MDEALLTSNTTLLADAYRRSHLELKIMDAVRADGIRADGAFGMSALVRKQLISSRMLIIGQHDGMLYNGNYGEPDE